MPIPEGVPVARPWLRLPPAIEVPPNTAEAMAFISQDSPVAGWEAASWEEAMIPTIEEQIPEIIYTKIFTLSTFTPERVLADGN